MAFYEKNAPFFSWKYFYRNENMIANDKKKQITRNGPIERQRSAISNEPEYC